MIDTRTSHREEALRALSDAGSSGLPLDAIGAGTGIHFAQMGWAVLSHEGGSKRVQITSQGRAHRYRQAHM